MTSSSSSTHDDGDAAASFSELLQFCSRAQTLMAELFVLCDHIPTQFLDRRFDPILFDLRYLESPSEFESRIEGNVELEVLEDQLRESCGEFMQRFFFWANGTVVYHSELISYLNDLQEGVPMHYRLDMILDNGHGRQLLTESITLFGCLVILMEHLLRGSLREKLLVAYLRFKRLFDFPNLKHIYALCCIHQAGPDQFRHALPLSLSVVSIEKLENLLSRFPFPKFVVDAIISRLRNDDLYGQLHHYPDPQHRTVALSSQAGCLCILLLYSPGFLHDGFVMREIVDRFLKDVWVVPVFLNYSVDLFVLWDTYKEAKVALSSCLTPSIIRDYCLYHCTQVRHLLSEIDSARCSSGYTRDYVMDNFHDLFSLFRNCNISLRWLLLHQSTMDKRSRDIINSIGFAEQVDENSFLALLLKTSILEYEVEQLLRGLLGSRDAMWNQKKTLVSDSMKELSEQHLGSWASACKINNDNLKDWFQRMSSEIREVECRKSGSSGKIIHRIISALRDIEQFHQIQENVQVKQHVIEIQKHLHYMMRALNFDNECLSTFSMITSAVYAWGFVGRFSKLLSKKIERDPSVTLTLHTFFLKFRLLLTLPIQRIAQNQSPDLLCASNYYSSLFEAHICFTLETIPALLLRMLSKDGLQSQQSLYLVNRVEKKTLQSLFQLGQQVIVGKAASEVSTISEGIMNMARNSRTLISLDIKNWLEEKIREELTEQIEKNLNSFCQTPTVGHGNLDNNLSALSIKLIALMETVELLQDLLHMTKNIWQETLSEVLRHCAEVEHANLARKELDLESPAPQSSDVSESDAFFGNLLNQVLHVADPLRSMFIDAMSGWFDANGHELLGLQFFHLLDSCVGQAGLTIFDSLIVVLIKKNLQLVLRNIRNSVKIANPSWELVHCLAKVGQLQLFRCMISFQLRLPSKAFTKQSILYGSSSPLQSIYVTEEPPALLGRFASVLSMSQLSRYIFDTQLGSLTSRMKKSVVDFSPLVIGLGTLLWQFDPLYITHYVQHMGQYTRMTIEVAYGTASSKTPEEPTSEVLKCAFWLMHFCKYMGISQDLTDTCLPPYLIAVLHG